MRKVHEAQKKIDEKKIDERGAQGTRRDNRCEAYETQKEIDGSGARGT